MPTPTPPRPRALRLPLRAVSVVLVACAAAFAAPPAAIAETPPKAEADGLAQQLVSRALGLLGVPYKWGGDAPESGLDCSGLVRHVFEDAAGMVLPRRAIEMSRAGAPVGRTELQPGDLVFFNTLRRAFSHVGIYIGDGRFVHAPSAGGKVRVEKISGGYWASRFNGGRRLLDGEDADHAGSALAAAGLPPAGAYASTASAGAAPSAGASAPGAPAPSPSAGLSSTIARASSAAASLAASGLTQARDAARSGARAAAPITASRAQYRATDTLASPFDSGY